MAEFIFLYLAISGLKKQDMAKFNFLYLATIIEIGWL
jgi:hypothetical protein